MPYLFLIGGLLVYYVSVWLRATPILRPHSVVTRYQPPAGLSPAGVRYVWMGGEGVWSGGADARSVAATLADLAYRQHISIQASGTAFALQRTPAAGSGPLTYDEKSWISRLLPSTELCPLEFDGRMFYSPARYELEKSLWYNLQDRYYTTNLKYRLIGIALSLVGVFVLCSRQGPQANSENAVVAVALLAAGIALGSLAIDQLRNAPRLGFVGPWLRPAAPYVMSAVLAVIMAAVFSRIMDAALGITAAAIVVINLLFGVWLRAPTTVGKRTLDEIAGYREFLESVERPVMDRMARAEQSGEFAGDEHLAYLIALDVRDDWGDKLTAAISHVIAQEEVATNTPHAVDA